MSVKVLELRGYKSLRAYNAFSTLMLGLKMLPAYMNEPYEAFLERIEAMPPEDQEKMVREAVKFVELSKDEVEALISFCCDPHGIPYSKVNLDNLKPHEFMDLIVAVCMEIAKLSLDFVTADEKKKLKIGQ